MATDGPWKNPPGFLSGWSLLRFTLQVRIRQVFRAVRQAGPPQPDGLRWMPHP